MDDIKIKEIIDLITLANQKYNELTEEEKQAVDDKLFELE